MIDKVCDIEGCNELTIKIQFRMPLILSVSRLLLLVALNQLMI
jgi:hypothetical protein